MQDVVADVQVRPGPLEVTVYELMAAPPLEAGAVHETVADPDPATAVGDVGAPGTVAGVPETADELGPVPIALTAWRTTV